MNYQSFASVCLILIIVLIITVKVQSSCLVVQLNPIQPDSIEPLRQNPDCQGPVTLSVGIWSADQKKDVFSVHDTFNLEKDEPILIKVAVPKTEVLPFAISLWIWVTQVGKSPCVYHLLEKRKEWSLPIPFNITWQAQLVDNFNQFLPSLTADIRATSQNCTQSTTMTTTTSRDAFQGYKVSARPPSRLYLHKLAIMECIVVVNCTISICIYLYFGWYKRVSAPYIKYLEKMDKVTQKLYRSKKNNR